MRVLAAIVLLVAVAAAGGGAPPAPPPEPSGAHPRMLLDDELRAAWRADAQANRGPVAASLALCREARETNKHDQEGYQGSEWARMVQVCLVAWAATGAPEHAATALRFFVALLDDLEVVGDGKGGDTSGQRDDGYAIRNLGPFTALAYDWLHDAPGMTPELRAHARARWDSWLTWYSVHGYRARVPGSNYQAGYIAATTMIAIAQGSEAGEVGARLWRFVADEQWGKDMAAALAADGILEGGDWPEGWQYGPLAVANTALAARVARRAGIAVAGVEAWLSSVLRRHVHGLSPVNQVYPAGDTQFEVANIKPRELVMTAIALGDAPARDRRWARGERARLGLADDDYLLFDALGMAGEEAEQIPRASWPTWYLARGAGNLYARTRWDDRAVWLVAECRHQLAEEHHYPNAGTFVLSRGRDDVIVDPSPYGAQSTLTGNAPTVLSAQLPADVIPSQGRRRGPRPLRTGWRWATQTRSGVIAGRCDYADQYRLVDRPSDVPEAVRDLVVVPSADGTDASLVVVDRAVTGAGDRAMYLRFRVPGTALALAGDVGTATLGATRLAIAGPSRSSGQPRLVASTEKSCEAVKGRCEAARIPVTDYRLEVAGPEPRAVHVISATGAAAPAPTRLAGDGWEGVRIAGPRDAVVVWARGPGATLRYRAPRAAAVTHVVLDAPSANGKAWLIARPDGDACAIEVSAVGAGGTVVPARPVIVALDEVCAVAADPERVGETPATPSSPPSRRPSGCCGARSAPAPTIATAAITGIALLRRRRRAVSR